MSEENQSLKKANELLKKSQADNYEIFEDKEKGLNDEVN